MAGMTKPMSTILIAAVLIAAAVMPRGEAKITCGKVVARLSRCLPYLRDKGPLAAKCCEGVKGLNDAADNRTDRQKVCSCLKSLATSISGINFDKAAGLPKKCGVNVPYIISPNIDCSKYVFCQPT